MTSTGTTAPTAAKARELLKQAGKTHVTTQLAVREAQPQDTEAAVFIQEALRQVGVDVEIQKLPDAELDYKRLNSSTVCRCSCTTGSRGVRTPSSR